MIRPAFCCRMIGRTALVVRITPKRFTSNNAWAWFIEDSSAPASRPVPALFTRTSILPVVSSTLSTAIFTDASSVTSQVTIVIPSRVLATARRLAREEGLLLGSTSGINVAAAVAVAKQLGRGHTVVTVLCDGGAKYQSRLFNKDWIREKGFTEAVAG